MSYILDALKKSDAERKRGEVPTLSDAPPAPSSILPSGRPPLVLIAAGVAGFCIAGGVGAWLLLSGDDAPKPAHNLAQTAAEEPTAPAPTPASTVEPSETGQTTPEPTIPEQSAPETASEAAYEAAAPETAPETVPEAAPVIAPTSVAEPTPEITPQSDAKTEPKAEPVAEPMPEPQEVATLNAKPAPAPTVESNAAPIPEPTQPIAVVRPEAKSPAALKNAKAYIDRAWTNVDKGLYEQALSDLDQALNREPANAEAWFARGWTLEKNGGEAAAIVDYGRAIDAQPGHAMALFSRGFLHLYGGNPQDAVVDFVRTQGVAKDESLRLYSHLWLYLSRVRAGQNAQERLKGDTGQASLTQWPGPLILHFLGNMNESAVLTFIEQGTKSGLTERRATGYFFLGISALISDDKDRARTYFEKTLATGAIDFRQYDAARRELKNLR